MTYATVNELKGYLSIGTADVIDDSQLTDALTSATDLIDGYCGRSFTEAGTAVTDRVYAASASCYVPIDDAAEVTTVATSTALDGTYDYEWDDADWQAEPLNGIVGGRAWPVTTIRAVGSQRFSVGSIASVQVSGRFGWTAVPSSVKQACLIQSARLFKRANSPVGIAGGPETGLMRVTGSVDTDVQRLLLPYRKSPGIGVA